MNNKELLLKEIEDVPEGKIQEVIDFVRFLKAKQREEEFGITLVSEPFLASDWDKPEEDEAWSDL
ncbi:MAG: DUF2281 domain-containing protein [Bacteroidota bacterium]